MISRFTKAIWQMENHFVLKRNGYGHHWLLWHVWRGSQIIMCQSIFICSKPAMLNVRTRHWNSLKRLVLHLRSMSRIAEPNWTKETESYWRMANWIRMHLDHKCRPFISTFFTKFHREFLSKHCKSLIHKRPSALSEVHGLSHLNRGRGRLR